jgi:hypothetical protein
MGSTMALDFQPLEILDYISGYDRVFPTKFSKWRLFSNFNISLNGRLGKAVGYINSSQIASMVNKAIDKP